MRRTWWVPCALGWLALGCGGDVEDSSVADGDPIIIGSDAEALVSGAVDHRVSYSCTGYTTGGGQKVVGRIDIGPQRDSGMWDVYFTVTNYKKNIGWHKKETNSIGFDAVANGLEIHTDSSIYGSASEIGEAWLIDVADTLDVSATFYGRDGTSCSL